MKTQSFYAFSLLNDEDIDTIDIPMSPYDNVLQIFLILEYLLSVSGLIFWKAF